MRRLLTILASLALLIPSISTAQQFSQYQLIIKPFGSGVVMSTSTANGAKLQASSTPNVGSINATSTATSSLPRVSSTGFSVTWICFTGDICRTTWPTGGSSASSTLLSDINNWTGGNTFNFTTTTNATTTSFGISNIGSDSIVVTNPASSALQGSSTLAVNHGGTGATSFAAGNRFIITNGGTGPFTSIALPLSVANGGCNWTGASASTLVAVNGAGTACISTSTIAFQSFYATSTATSTITGGLNLGTLAIASTTATSTIAGGLSIDGGGLKLGTIKTCASPNALQTDANGGVICAAISATVTGPNSSIAAFNNSGTLIGSSTPSAMAFNATSSTATSTFAGPFILGSDSTPSLGAYNHPYLRVGSTTCPTNPTFYGYLEVCGSDNTTNGVQMQIGNSHRGTSAFAGVSFLNDRSDTNLTNYGYVGMNSSVYSDTTFGTAAAVPYQLQMWNSMGPVTIAAATSTSVANAYINFVAGGGGSGNEIARFTSAALGIATTSPGTTLSVNGPAVIAGALTAKDIIATSTFTIATLTGQSCLGTDGTGKLQAGSCGGGSSSVVDKFSTTTAGTGIYSNSAVYAGFGTTSPGSMLSIHATSTSGTGSPLSLFAIASSTSGTATTTLFSINNIGTHFGNLDSSTSTLFNLFSQSAMRFSTSSHNTAFGLSALAFATTSDRQNNEAPMGNVAFGDNALYMSTTSPGNTAVGFGALWGSGVVSGIWSAVGQNTALGYFALASSTSGNQNTSLGNNSGRLLTTANLSTFLGYQSGWNYKTQAQNTFLGASSGSGASSLNSNLPGAGSTNNTAVGYSAMGSIQAAATQNVAVGVSALTSLGSNSLIGTASRNTAVGYSSGSAVSGGDNNTFLGAQSGIGVTLGFDNIIIGPTKNTGGNNLTTGGGNICFGYNPCIATSTAARSWLNFGNLFYGILPATTTATQQKDPTYGAIGVASSSPWGLLSIQLNNNWNMPQSGQPAFAIGSSTATATTTLFSITNIGHELASSTSPTLSGCGTAPVLLGDDAHGEVTTGATAAGCTMTFALPYSVAPVCTVTPQTGSVTNTFSYSISASAITVTQAAIGGGKFDYICKGLTGSQ